ncbi:DUF3558 domain-containing protein [Rhodococcus sp. W8901]|uniref:DUF3558 domain-containing protein n=1 Tax=Rhodococcus sp. W8901 TaxID=2742603 RepID=UPI0015825194|nr:DUF3558 domain-containing protein [Rhodococcus sp. W8901]QKT10950.1 DUF3558 domain-containing protein [Rhodococcus sp. W8901]
MRLVAAVGLIGMGLVLAGCGSGEVSGKADPEAIAAGEPVFRPCDDIPDDALRGLGADPGTAERDIMGVKQSGWNVCGWSAADYDITVFATTHTLSDIKTNDRNEEFMPVDLGSREGFSYREASDVARERCYVAVESGDGSSILSISFAGLVDPRDAQEPCRIATSATHSLLPFIPA